MEAFVQVYMAYYQLKVAMAGTEGTYTEELKEALIQLDKYQNLGEYDGGFEQVSSIEDYRKLIPATDEGYKIFVKEVIEFRKNSPNYGEERKKISEEVKETWELLKANKEEVKEKGTKVMSQVKYALELYIPPQNKEGKYQYDFEEVKNYE